MIIRNAVVESIVYVTSGIGEFNKPKIMSLLYLADKYHLAKYGRTITGDYYSLTKDGPVGVMAKNILDTNNFPEIMRDSFSETDIDILDYVSEKFGKKKAIEISSYIQQYPECKNCQNLTESQEISTIAMLSKIDNDQLLQDIPEEHIKETREFLLGYF